MSAARGEIESFQLVLHNRSSEALADIRVEVSELPGIEADVYAAASVNVPQPGALTGALADRYFDLLRPAGWETVEPGAFRPYWIDLRVPSDGVKPGDYKGFVEVSAGGQSQRVPVELRVRPFTLPTTPSLKVAFAFGLNWMESYYGRKLSPAEIRAAQDMMLDHRLGPLPMWGAGKEFFTPETARHCLNRGMNIVLLKCGGHSDEEVEKSLDALEPKIALVEKLGALERTYLFGFDEICVCHPEAIPWMKKAYEGFHARHPGIKRINTSRPDERIADFVDIFVSPVRNYAPSMAETHEAWWYSVGSSDLNTEPDYRIDFPGALQRGFFTADWKVGVSGHLYWAVQREWPLNKEIVDKSRPEREWQTAYININSKKRTESNGAGNLFYPDGDGSMLATPRVKRIRDGIEDYEYLAQLEAAARELERRKPQDWLGHVDNGRKLLTVPDTVVAASATMVEGWTFAGGQSPFSITTHPHAIRNGKQALRVVPIGPEVDAGQDLAARPGLPYTVTSWIKTDDLCGDARVRVEFLDADGKTLLRRQSEPVSGSTGSKRFLERTVTVASAPSGTATLRIALTAALEPDLKEKPEQTPKAFFEDIEVHEGERSLAIRNSGFETTKLRITHDPATLLAYREQLGACLERCSAALLKSAAPK